MKLNNWKAEDGVLSVKENYLKTKDGKTKKHLTSHILHDTR